MFLRSPLFQVMEDSKDFIVKDFDFYHQEDEDDDGDQNEQDFMVGLSLRDELDFG